VKIFNNPEDWLVSKNTHGAIIDAGTWKRYRKSGMASEEHHG